MLPIRFIAEKFGFLTQWNPDTQTITITKQAESEQEINPQTAEENSKDDVSDKKVLVAYFTWSGNTEEMAEYIAEQTNGDLYKIEPKTPYPNEYNKCGEVAKVERDDNVRPEIANLPDNIDEYDTIYIGYPIWWHTAPMIIGTFLESSDFSGADIYPFTQSASMDTEQFENSMKFIKDCAKNANVHDGLFTQPDDINKIDDYIQK